MPRESEERAPEAHTAAWYVCLFPLLGTHFYSIHRGDELALELTDADGLDGTDYSPELSQRYLYGSAVDEILAVEDAAGDVLWGLADHEGTIRDIVDSTGTVQEHRQYDTFGQIVSPANRTADFPQAFTGRPLDADTDLYEYRARWYDPAVGRFVSEDPSGFAGGDANLYRYAGNSPVIYVDPSGLSYEGVSGPVGDAIRDFLDNELVTAAMELGISLMPGFGEFMDLGIAFDSHYSPLERGIAGISFAIGVATLGTSPNVAPFLRATRGLGRMLNRADDVVDVARGLARTAGRGADEVATGVARGARRGADDVATGLAKTPRRTAADRVRRFLADESGTLRIPGGQAPRGKGVGPNDVIPDGFSFDIDSPKYRQLKYGSRRLDYSVDGGKLSVDWVEGGKATPLLKEVVEAEGSGIHTIEGYATFELGRLSDKGLLRYGRQVARQLARDWTVSIRTDGVKRFLVFTR